MRNSNSLFAFTMTPWRNGSASDSRSEGCVFESRRGQNKYFFFLFIYNKPQRLFTFSYHLQKMREITVNHLSPLCSNVFLIDFVHLFWKLKSFELLLIYSSLILFKIANILNLLQLILWMEPKTEWRKEQRGWDRAVGTGGQEGHLPPRFSQEWK